MTAPFLRDEPSEKNPCLAGRSTYAKDSGHYPLDVAIMPNVFMRGEWETIAFTNVGAIASSLNTVRAGVGVRF
jgi:hypothetical protein